MFKTPADRRQPVGYFTSLAALNSGQPARTNPGVSCLQAFLERSDNQFRARRQILKLKPVEQQHSSQLTNQSILLRSLLVSFYNFQNYGNCDPECKSGKHKTVCGTEKVTGTFEKRALQSGTARLHETDALTTRPRCLLLFFEKKNAIKHDWTSQSNRFLGPFASTSFYNHSAVLSVIQVLDRIPVYPNNLL